MKNFLHITALVDKPELLENIVEQLAVRHYDIGYGNASVPISWRALDTSSIESYVSGNVQLTLDGEKPIKMPFISCFLFTCTKEKKDPYKLNWSFSLS
jgi:hypothetical protein